LKKVLIITYYWPPSGGSGVQRWVKFTKYLRQFGWEPIIYTVENGEYPEIDLSLQKDIPEDIQVVKGKIIEPFRIYKKFVGKKKEERLKVGVITESKKGSWKDKIALWIRSNLFIPDARMLWIYPSVNKLKKFLSENPVDLIVSTGPPHSNHLIAYYLKKALGTKWIADFRDPWTEIYYFNDLSLTNWAKKIHLNLEKRVLLNADRVVVVGNGMRQNFLKKGVDSVVITNGYDEEDFSEQVDKDQIFSIVHTGTIVHTNNHQVVWEAIGELYENEKFENFELKLIGKVDPQLVSAAQTFSFKDKVKISSYIPHSEIVKVQKAAHLLILLLEPTTPVVTGKVFEYLGSRSNILAIGSKTMNHEIYDIFKNLKNSLFCEMDEKEKIKSFILKSYSGDLGQEPKESNLNQYTRKTLTRKMVDIFNSLI
jgi:glycosyltransferase involved in cell wall biosynthesis